MIDKMSIIIKKMLKINLHNNKNNKRSNIFSQSETKINKFINNYKINWPNIFGHKGIQKEHT